MSLKKAGARDIVEKKRRVISIAMKREILEKYGRGVRVADLAKQYQRTTSTICTVLKQEAALRAAQPAKGIRMISHQRTSIHESMEKLLMDWLEEKQIEGVIVAEAVIREKAREIYADLVQQIPGPSEGNTSCEPFKASRGWYDNFKRRCARQSERIHVAANADINITEEYTAAFTGIVAAEGFTPQQVFSCGETGLFWKKMPKKTFITVEEEEILGHKPMKDKLNLVLCCNAIGECKVKPLLVYHSENPKAFKSHKILKEKLQVMWRANPRAWITRQFFVEWINLVFGPEVKKYLLENNLPLKVLLVLDNSPSHPPNLEECILDEFKFVKVLYIPSEITCLIQPMDEPVMSNFKMLFTKHLFRRCFEVTESTNLSLRDFWRDHYNIVLCLRIIDMAWQDPARKTLIWGWKKLWHELMSEADYDKLEPEEDAMEEVLFLAKSMGLAVDEADIVQLIEEHSEELTTDELKDLQAQQLEEVLEGIDEPEEEEDVMSTWEIREMLGMWEKLSDFIQKKHPEKVATGRATAQFNDICLAHFRNILKARMKQEMFSLKRPPDDSEKIMAKQVKVDNDSQFV